MSSWAYLMLPCLRLILRSTPKTVRAEIRAKPLPQPQTEPLSDTYGTDPKSSLKALKGLKTKLMIEPELTEGGSEFAI